MNNKQTDRTISLASATFIIVGYVIGASIFILPGSLAAGTGPAVFVAYALAAIPAILAGFVMAQIGSVLPVSGANYVLLRDALTPYSGFLYQWIMVSMAAVVVPVIAFGFADYLGYFVPGLPSKAVAAVLVLVFIVLNTFGIGVASAVQTVMVIVFVVVLAVFGSGGVAFGDPGHLQPLFPKGYSVLAIAAITAYFSYAGVFVIAEIAGEIKQPGRNIPKAILLAFVIIIVLYTMVPLALSMLVPWQQHGRTPMAVVTASQLFLPGPFVSLIAIAALFAAATSVNGILLGLSRDFYQAANDGLFPPWFARVGPKTGTPVRAVMLVGLLSFAGLMMGGAIIDFAQLALIGLMIIQIMTGVALIRLPQKMPQAFARSAFQLSRHKLIFVGIAYMVFSLLFLVILAAEKVELLLIGIAYLLAGVIYRLIRNRRVK